MTMPASTMPMIWGMRNLLMTIGAMRMMKSTTKKISVGSEMGKYEANNVILCAKVRIFCHGLVIDNSLIIS